MHFDIPDDVNETLLGLNWMLGTWQGNGHGTWPDTGDFDFGQQIEFSTNGGPFLHYMSQMYVIDHDGKPVKPLTMETGFWRPNHDNADLEVLLSHPEGFVEVWTGKVQGAKIELTTDVVARTDTASLAYTGGQRLYGNVNGDLMWTWDRATDQIPMQPYMWAQLKKVAG
jgi:hypothetical protein